MGVTVMIQGGGINNESSVREPARPPDVQRQIQRQIPCATAHQSVSGNSVSLSQRKPLPIPVQDEGKYQESLINSLKDGFRQRCDGSALPGGGIMGNDGQLAGFVQENLLTINRINRNIQEAASGGECFEDKNLLELDQTGILVPAGQTGHSRLTSGNMGYDMKLSDKLLQEDFYQELLQVEGRGLEIGSGYGELCLKVLANDKVRQLECIEPQITQLLVIQARVRERDPGSLNKLILVNNLFPEGYGDKDPAQYDFIICHRVFSVTPTATACRIIDQACRLLKPGGRLFLLSLCDQHPDFQKNMSSYAGPQKGDSNGLIEVATRQVLPDQAYNLPENITFISQKPFESFLVKTGFNIKSTSFPSTTNTGKTAVTSNRNIAFVAQKAGSE